MNEDIIINIYDSIPNFIESIEAVIEGVVSEKGVYAEQASCFLQNCLDLFPKIIRSYATDSLIEYANDVEYWTNLLNKIIQTFQNTDRYRIIDVLYFETKQSVLEYKMLIEDLELIK